MIAARIQGFTRELAKDQPQFRGLWIRDEPVQLKDGSTVNAMVSLWEPTGRELERLQAGGKVYLQILGLAHPPVAIWVPEQ